ncbi:MAG: hypothetical protein RIQ52_1043 [Pseudomonadota bacterium]|jgi:light-regulated signal transduction histidine kinase (bacteriophytochrome)
MVMMDNQLKSSDGVLTGCDLEPIHTPGSIQSHGILLVLDPETMVVLQCSANAGQLFPVCAGGDIPGQPLSQLVPAEVYARQLAVPLMESRQANPSGTLVTDLAMDATGKLWDLVVHWSNGLGLLEFEPAPAERSGIPPSLDVLHQKLEAISGLQNLLQAAVDLILAMTDYDRVLVYNFMDDTCGLVLAEARRAPEVPSLMGLRFPAGDIPKQARQLYLLNRIRCIANVGSEQSPLLPLVNPKTFAPTDLSLAVLRSVSSIHIQYLSNMKVTGALSLSLVVEGKLWGMLICHRISGNYHPDTTARMGLSALADTISRLIALQINEARHAAMDHLKAMMDLLETSAGQCAHEDTMLWEGDIASICSFLLNFVNADGCSLSCGGYRYTSGCTPDAGEMPGLLAWLESLELQENIWVTHRLSALYPAAQGFRNRVSGMMVLKLSGSEGGYMLLFREEWIHTIAWAGAPGHGLVPHTEIPRGSFAPWKELVRGQSYPWSSMDIEMAQAFRHHVVSLCGRIQKAAASTDHMEES